MIKLYHATASADDKMEHIPVPKPGQIKLRMVRDITELRDWPENRIRNAIWNLSNCMCPGHGGPTDAEEYRRELRARGLDDRGHHNT